MGPSELNKYVLLLSLLMTLVFAGLAGTIYGLQYFAALPRASASVRAEAPPTAATPPAHPVTGPVSSVWLFMYQPPGTHVSVRFLNRVLYSDPKAEDSKISGSVNNLGIAAGNTTYDALYYQYTSPVQKPREGWLVPISELDSWITSTAATLGLHSQETAKLKHEIEQASGGHGEQLFIGLIPQAEIEADFPVEAGTAHIERYQFYVSQAEASERLTPPQLTPVVRTPSLAIELGVVSQ